MLTLTSNIAHTHKCIADKHQIPGRVLLAPGYILLDPKHFSGLPLTSPSVQELHLLLMECVWRSGCQKHDCVREFEHTKKMDLLVMTPRPNTCLFFIFHHPPLSLSKSPEVRSRTQANFASESVSLSSGQTSCRAGIQQSNQTYLIVLRSKKQ